MGRPGKPAPDPRSTTSCELRALSSEQSGCGTRDVCRKRWWARKNDSPKWRVTISSGLRIAVRLMRAFQRSSKSMYIDVWLSWAELSDRTNGASNSEIRFAFMRLRAIVIDPAYSQVSAQETGPNPSASLRAAPGPSAGSSPGGMALTARGECLAAGTFERNAGMTDLRKFGFQRLRLRLGSQKCVEPWERWTRISW